jgi:hypothetical protein
LILDLRFVSVGVWSCRFVSLFSAHILYGQDFWFPIFRLGVCLTPLLRVGPLPSVSGFCFSGGLSSELCARGFRYRAVSSTRPVSVPAGVGPKASFFLLVQAPRQGFDFCLRALLLLISLLRIWLFPPARSALVPISRSRGKELT